MSTVKDSQGNILNNPGPGCGRYTDENSLTVDWFDSHPHPVEKTQKEKFVEDCLAHGTTSIQVGEASDPVGLNPDTKTTKVEFHVAEVPATLPPNSGDALKVVAPVAEALSAGVTTSSLPQTTVNE